MLRLSFEHYHQQRITVVPWISEPWENTLETCLRSWCALNFPSSLQTKCHQYWPDPPDVMEYGGFRVRCHSEDCTIAYVVREMVITNVEVNASCLKLCLNKLNENICIYVVVYCVNIHIFIKDECIEYRSVQYNHNFSKAYILKDCIVL